MRVLHITNWYPSKDTPFRTLFIKEHFDALNMYSSNELLHLEVQESTKPVFKIKKNRISNNESFHFLITRKIPWRIKEILTTLLLIHSILSKKINKRYDIVNFHIAYPLLTYTKILFRFIKIPIVITEHWTAYHFNFMLPKSTKKLNRIKYIYNHKIPVITVSKALNEDISQFSGFDNYKNFVVPNVIAPDFRLKSVSNLNHNITPRFFMVNLWRSIKSPFICFDAFKSLLVDYPNAVLRVGGYGPLWIKMEEYVKNHKLENNIILLGKLTKDKIALELQEITAFIHASSYETFSVVTAEAICCGTPVVVSDISAIKEFINNSNGITVNSNSIDEWEKSLKSVIINNNSFVREDISKNALALFSKEEVGKIYNETLEKIIKEHSI